MGTCESREVQRPAHCVGGPSERCRQPHRDTFYLDETYEMPKYKYPLKRVPDSGVDESGSSSQKENAEPKDI